MRYCCFLTRLIKVWMPRLVRNQYMNVPSGGIILGYFFVCCSLFCSPVRCGPYWRGICCFNRLPWEGGLNLVGFSRTRGFEVLADAFRHLGKLWRTTRGGLIGLANSVYESRDRRGRRKRGTERLIFAANEWESFGVVSIRRESQGLCN